MSPALTWGPIPLPTIAFANIAAESAGTTSVVISWDVSPAASGEVRYGLDDGGPYPFVTKRQVAPLDHHAQRINGLPEGEDFFYVVWGMDPASGVEAVSEQGTFSTGTTSLDYPTPIPLAYLAKPTFTAPVVGEVKTDPQYGTEVARVSTAAREGVRYASKAVLNANESLGLLDKPATGSGSSRLLFDGQSLAPLVLNNSTYGALTWSNTDPNRAYAYVNPNIIRILEVTSAGISVVRSIALTGVTAMILGGLQGSQDNADTYLAIQAQKSNGNLVYILFSIATETVVGEVVVASSGSMSIFDSCGISQSGAYFLGGFAANGTGTTQGQWRWPTASFSNANRLQLTTQNRHWDAGLLADGTTDVLFICSQNATGTSNGGYAGIFRFDNGAWTPLVANWPNGSPSCRNILRPGYGYLSSFSDMDTNPTFPGYSTVLAVEFAAPPVAGGDVEVYGNIHGPYSTAYLDQPNACPSRDGTRVFTNTTWDGAPAAAFVFGEDVIR